MQLSLSSDTPLTVSKSFFLPGLAFVDYKLDTTQVGEFNFTIAVDDGNLVTQKSVQVLVKEP